MPTKCLTSLDQLLKELYLCQRAQNCQQNQEKLKRLEGDYCRCLLEHNKELPNANHHYYTYLYGELLRNLDTTERFNWLLNKSLVSK